jgi:RNA polymerase sigma-70 factor (ECF subfamily)
MSPRLAIAKQEVAGNADPIQAFYERHAAVVKRWARRLAGPTVDLEDLVHDIFLVAIKKGFQRHGEASIDTWLFRITHHVILGKRRRRALRALLFGRHQDDLVPPSANTPLEEMEHRERQARLYHALDRLPDRYRTALVLYEIEELSGEEVAELTGTSVGTVWVRLHRGRERLVELLKQEDPA